MAAPYTPTPASKFFTAPPTTHNVSMGYLWDSDATGVNSSTGKWRAITPDDFSDISITGLTVSVGAVAVTGTTTTVPASSVTTNNYVPSGNVGITAITGTVFAPNPTRIQSYIQNIGSGGPLFVKLGPAPASQQSFSMILSPASTDFGANGGIWSDNGFWKGEVSVSGTTRIIAWQA